MKLAQSMKASCKSEEQKFYRGDESMTGVCSIVKCSTKFAEHRIISYVSKNFSRFGILYKTLPHQTAFRQQMWLQKGWPN